MNEAAQENWEQYRLEFCKASEYVFSRVDARLLDPLHLGQWKGLVSVPGPISAEAWCPEPRLGRHWLHCLHWPAGCCWGADSNWWAKAPLAFLKYVCRNIFSFFLFFPLIAAKAGSSISVFSIYPDPKCFLLLEKRQENFKPSSLPS